MGKTQSGFVSAENQEKVRLMVIEEQGGMPVEVARQADSFGMSISRILFSGEIRRLSETKRNTMAQNH